MKRIFYFLIVIMLLSCRKDPVQIEMKMDAIVAEAFDSLVYGNTDYARRLLEEAMKEVSDSLDFYKALQTYSLTYFVVDQSHAFHD